MGGLTDFAGGGRALEDVEVFGVFDELGDELDGGGAGADEADGFAFEECEALVALRSAWG